MNFLCYADSNRNRVSVKFDTLPNAYHYTIWLVVLLSSNFFQIKNSEEVKRLQQVY